MTIETDKVYFDRIYVGKANPKWRGKLCRILNTWRGRGPHNFKIQFLCGEMAIVPMRCVRKIKQKP